MRGITTSLLALGLAAAAPAAAIAQSKNEQPTKADAQAEPSEKEVAAMMQSIFKVEPLTAEQQSRLPQAQKLIARIMPPGTMGKMLGGMYDKLVGPIMKMAGDASASDAARELGVEAEELELEDEEAARILAILDPVWKERQEAEMAAMQRAMSAVMTAMEPGMRKGMSEAYAIAFTSAELTDIDRFFATPSGATYAAKSYALASDPRLMAAAMEGLPQMMAQFKTMEEETKAASAKFPPRRGYADLTPAQREEIAKLTGLQQGTIREGMERASAERAKKQSLEDYVEDIRDE